MTSPGQNELNYPEESLVHDHISMYETFTKFDRKFVGNCETRYEDHNYTGNHYLHNHERVNDLGNAKIRLLMITGRRCFIQIALMPIFLCISCHFHRNLFWKKIFLMIFELLCCKLSNISNITKKILIIKTYILQHSSTCHRDWICLMWFIDNYTSKMNSAPISQFVQSCLRMFFTSNNSHANCTSVCIMYF